MVPPEKITRSLKSVTLAFLGVRLADCAASRPLSQLESVGPAGPPLLLPAAAARSNFVRDVAKMDFGPQSKGPKGKVTLKTFLTQSCSRRKV